MLDASYLLKQSASRPAPQRYPASSEFKVSVSRNNTVVLVDLENLIEGYSDVRKSAAAISLSSIVDAVSECDSIRGVAVLRAYANWSDPRLEAFRKEVNRLGIEPVQVFGLGRNASKNVADIQLAVDAIDLAHIRPSLEVYAIVSGDGGFSALAKKLREYGKVVVGAGYRSSTNDVLHSLCDHFVWIERDSQASGQTVAASGDANLTAQSRRLIAGLSALAPGWEAKAGLKTARSLFGRYDSMARADLENGIQLNLVRAALGGLLPEFNHRKFGFAKFSEFLAYASSGTPVCFARLPNNQPVLTHRKRYPSGATIVEAKPPANPDSQDHYRVLLATSVPPLKIPEDEALGFVIEWLDAHAPLEASFSELLSCCTEDLGVPHGSIKDSLSCLIQTGSIEHSPQNVPWPEKLFCLPQGFTARAACDAVFALALERLEDEVETVDVQRLRGLIHGCRER